MIEDFMRQSAMTFFHPNDAFFDYFNKHPWRLKQMHDIGAGLGKLTQQMTARGFSIKAYDKYERLDACVPVQVIDVLEKFADIRMFDLIIMARPCHGGFVEEVARKYLDQGDMFYTSLPCNVPDDLSNLVYTLEVENVGQDGENLYRIWGVEGQSDIYRRIFFQGIAAWWQWRPHTQRYVNSTGIGGFNATGDETVLAEQKAAHIDMFYDEHDPSENDGNYGWLEPNGTFWGCNYAAHKYVAQSVFGVDESRLEGLGWLKLNGKFYSQGQRYDGDMKITAEQSVVLKAKGYKVRDRNDFIADINQPL